MSSSPTITESKCLDFPPEEFQRRVAQAQAQMRAQGMAALLVSHLDNIFYFTGYRSWLRDSQHRPFAAVLPTAGDPILILPSLETGNANLKSWVRDVRLWQAADDYVALYCEALREMGAGERTVGIELGDDMWLGMPAHQWGRLQQTVPKVRFVSSTDLMWQLRSVKSPAEVAHIRRAAQITDRSVVAAWDALRPGVTELEIAAAIGESMLAHGAEAPTFLIVKSGFGAYNAGNKYATPRVIQPGDIVTLDIGCSYRGYTSDMIRSACLGQPDPEHRRLQEVALALNRACMGEVKAGVPIRKIDEARQRFLKENGFPIPPYAGVGHNLGIAFHEMPRIGPEGDGVLQAGNVITVEPSIKAGPWGGIAVEDMLLVTDTGYEYLTTASRELHVKAC
jgi:Xaa-Pro aminopeptidase